MSLAWLLTMLAATMPGWVVVEPAANLHSRPCEEAEVVSQAIYGTNVELAGQEDGWVRVRTPDDYTGWAPLASLLKREAGCYASGGRVAEVRNLFANLYRDPDVVRRRPLLTVPFETRLEVIGEPEEEDRRWIRVRLPDERAAWVQRGDVTLSRELLGIEQTIALAKRFLGLPYLWGGASSFGYDCSAFTQMLCRRRGVTIPRDSGEQARWEGVEAVERDELRPGDLVFFGASEERITHTGMYAGDGEFIHVTAYLRPVVQVSKLDDAHWSELLVACRRLKSGDQR